MGKKGVRTQDRRQPPSCTYITFRLPTSINTSVSGTANVLSAYHCNATSHTSSAAAPHNAAQQRQRSLITRMPVVTPVALAVVVARRPIVATTGRHATWCGRVCWGPGGRRRWRAHLALVSILLELYQHVPQLMVPQMHLHGIGFSVLEAAEACRRGWLTLPPKWSARRRSESRTDR